MKRSAIKRGEPLRARRWGVRPAPKKPSWRDAYLPARDKKGPKRAGTDRDDPAYRKFVRDLGFCVCCHHVGPVDAAHMTTSLEDRGMGLKSHDRLCVPMRRDCHREWDTHSGKFAGMSRAQRFDKGAKWVKAIQLLATPDTLEQAFELEARGLGTVLRQVQGQGWCFLEGPQRKDAA